MILRSQEYAISSARKAQRKMSLSQFPLRPGNADIDIVVSYQPWFLPWTREKTYRFKTYKQTNGNFY